jgi:PadR family transcriptional regulator, regulatory protein AphA
MMPEKNKTKYAILGVLNLRPGSGYDIKKFCDKTISHYWNENFGNIYPMLSQLENEGLIEQECAGSDTRRKCYSITDSGKAELCQWLEQPVEYRPARSELLLKVSFAGLMPGDKVIEMLESVRKKYVSELKQYKVLEASYINDEDAAKHPQFPYWLAPLRYGIESAAMTIKWCEETMASLKNHRTEA